MAKKTRETVNDPKTIFGIDPAQAAALLAKLSPRQREVAEALAVGVTSREIAGKLGLSVKTVDIHRSMVCLKFDSHSGSIPRIVFAAKFAGQGAAGSDE